MTAYNGIARTYDRIGNLLTDGTWTYTWQNGRELASMTDGKTTWSYTYDANGMRTSRTNGTTTYNYVYNGSQLTQMTVGNDTLYFTYGLLGPATVTWNGTTYYYALNGQGDVVGIFDQNGDLVVAYNWDNAWGYNPMPEGIMASTLGTLNPLRYRSYVYDTETGYYYLQSRYYDPEIGRFINADGLIATGQGLLGNNMFAYCLNNPVNLADRGGNNAGAAGWWASTMWWLCGVDTVLPVGDIIYGAGILILGVCALTAVDDIATPQVSLKEDEKETEIEPPDVTYPGDDPSKAPDGYEWRGPDKQGGKRGGYANPNGKDSWHPDLDHPDGIKPHWDYNDGLKHKWRVYPTHIELDMS